MRRTRPKSGLTHPINSCGGIMRTSSPTKPTSPTTSSSSATSKPTPPRKRTSPPTSPPKSPNSPRSWMPGGSLDLSPLQQTPTPQQQLRGVEHARPKVASALNLAAFRKSKKTIQSGKDLLGVRQQFGWNRCSPAMEISNDVLYRRELSFIKCGS